MNTNLVIMLGTIAFAPSFLATTMCLANRGALTFRLWRDTSVSFELRIVLSTVTERVMLTITTFNFTSPHEFTPLVRFGYAAGQNAERVTTAQPLKNAKTKAAICEAEFIPNTITATVIPKPSIDIVRLSRHLNFWFGFAANAPLSYPICHLLA